MSASKLNVRCRSKIVATFVLATSTGALAAAAGDQPVMGGSPVFIPESIIVPAQATGGGSYGGGGTDGPDKDNKRLGNPTASSSPEAVGDAMRAATKFCGNLPGDEYAIDCLAYEYWEIQKQLPDYGEMADVKKVLAQTSKQLRKLAQDNQSSTKRPIRITKGGRKHSRALVPVERKQLPKLKREAAAIINNGATLLIRASGDSNRKRAQYQQIAKSMRTGAIMLRSL